MLGVMETTPLAPLPDKHAAHAEAEVLLLRAVETLAREPKEVAGLLAEVNAVLAPFYGEEPGAQAAVRAVQIVRRGDRRTNPPTGFRCHGLPSAPPALASVPLSFDDMHVKALLGYGTSPAELGRRARGFDRDAREALRRLAEDDYETTAEVRAAAKYEWTVFCLAAR